MRDLQLYEEGIARFSLSQDQLWLIVVFWEMKQQMTRKDYLELLQLLIKEAVSVVSVWQWMSDQVPPRVQRYFWYNSEITWMALAFAGPLKK